MILQVLKYEPEWSVTYEDVLVYLKESYAMMIVNLKYIALQSSLCILPNFILRCYGEKIAVPEGEKGDISDVVNTLVTYLEKQVKSYISSQT